MITTGTYVGWTIADNRRNSWWLKMKSSSGVDGIDSLFLPNPAVVVAPEVGTTLVLASMPHMIALSADDPPLTGRGLPCLSRAYPQLLNDRVWDSCCGPRPCHEEPGMPRAFPKPYTLKQGTIAHLGYTSSPLCHGSIYFACSVSQQYRELFTRDDEITWTSSGSSKESHGEITAESGASELCTSLGGWNQICSGP